MATPWSFPILPVPGWDSMVLTMRRLTLGVAMHVTEDAMTLSSRPQSPSFITVLLTSDPGVSHPDADAVVLVNGTSDAIGALTGLCVAEADVASGGGCKSWSTLPISLGCGGPTGDWALVKLYMSVTGDGDPGHSISVDRMQATGSFSSETPSPDSVVTFSTTVLDAPSGSDAEACTLAGSRWLLVFQSAATVQVCAQLASSGIPTSVCTPYVLTDASGGETSLPLPPSPVSPLLRDGVSVYDSFCSGSGSPSASVYASFCSCSTPDGVPDGCNGSPSDFVSSTTPPDDDSGGSVVWRDDAAVVEALESFAIPRGHAEFPSYGDVHPTSFGEALGSCADPDTRDTPSIRHRIKTHTFSGDSVTDPVYGSLPASTTGELLDIAMQLCATEAWQTGNEDIPAWTCSGVSWSLAEEATACHEAPTWEFLVCTGDGGLNTTDVVSDATTWTPCQWPWNSGVPGDDVEWAPMRPGSVTGVCRDCVCDDGPRNASSCRPGLPGELLGFPGALLGGTSGGSAWDSAMTVGLQPYEVFWDAALYTGTRTPLYGSTSHDVTIDQGETATIWTEARVLRVSASSSPPPGTFQIRHVGDVAWAATSTCVAALGDTLRAVSWEVARSCPSVDPTVESYGFVRVLCSDNGVQFPRFVNTWDVASYVSTGCPGDVDFRTSPLHTLRSGYVRLTPGITVGLPRFPFQRWVPLGGLSMALVREGASDLSWRDTKCPTFRGSITRVSHDALEACPNNVVTRRGMGHGRPPIAGWPGGSVTPFVASRMWRGVSATCPPGETSTTYRTLYFEASTGQPLEPPHRLDAVTLLEEGNVLSSCLGNSACTGVVLSASFGSWNPIVPQSSAQLRPQWTVKTCLSGVEFDVPDDASPALNVAALGRNAPAILQSGTYDTRSFVAALSGLWSSIAVVPCTTPETSDCPSAIPDVYAPGGIFTGPTTHNLDDVSLTTPFGATCSRGDASDVCVSGPRFTGTECDPAGWTGGGALNVSSSRPYGNWTLAVASSSAIDCQAKDENLCLPRGDTFLGWGDDGSLLCADCNHPWSGDGCAKCSGCHPGGLTPRTAESVNVSCVDTTCDCSASSEWRLGGDGTCSVCRNDRQFARPYKVANVDGVVLDGDVGGWCWAILEGDTEAHPVAHGGPIVLGGFCEPYVNVTATNEANVCVYDTLTCFDPNTEGCVDWSTTCGEFSDEAASRAVGECVCTPPFVGPACDACNATTHPFDYTSYSRSQFPEVCYSWPEVCNARADALFSGDATLSRGWVVSPNDSLIASPANPNHPLSVAPGCACVGNPRGSSPDCVACVTGLNLYTHVVGVGLGASLLSLCVSPHPRSGEEDACGAGGYIGSIPSVTDIEVCVCREGWTSSDVMSKCDRCASGYVATPSGGCSRCPWVEYTTRPDGDAYGGIVTTQCPPGTSPLNASSSSCAFMESAPVFAHPVTNTSVVATGRVGCDCPSGHREWGPLVVSPGSNDTSPCGPCVPGTFGPTCDVCAVDCGRGSCGIPYEGLRPGCTCDPGWDFVDDHLPWYMQWCGDCARTMTTHYANDTHVVFLESLGACVACPEECPFTCFASDTTVDCPCFTESRETVVRNVSGTDVAADTPLGFGVCGGCASGLLGDPENGYLCGAMCEPQCTSAGECAWNSTSYQTYCVCSEGYAVSGITGACTVCADGYVATPSGVCVACPSPGCPHGTRCAFSETLGDSMCTCSDINRVLMTSSGTCGDCTPGIMEFQGHCTAVCPWSCGVGGACVSPSDPPGLHGDCACSPGYVHADASNPASRCSVCAPGFVSSGDTCVECRGECSLGVPCVWDAELGDARCDCASGNFMDSPVTWSSDGVNVTWTDCSGCISDAFVGEDCQACPGDCGHGACALHNVTHTPTCVCDPGWATALTPCSVCAPGALGPRCEILDCPEDHTSPRYVETLDVVACVCDPPFVDPITPLSGGSCTACLTSYPLRVGPLCERCPLGGCGSGGTCVWNGTSPTCVCDTGFTHDETGACRVCDPGTETGLHCYTCPENCTIETGETCVESNGVAVCECIMGHMRIDGFDGCFLPHDAEALDASQVSASPTPSLPPPPSREDVVTSTPMIVLIALGSAVVIVVSAICIVVLIRVCDDGRKRK